MKNKLKIGEIIYFPHIGGLLFRINELYEEYIDATCLQDNSNGHHLSYENVFPSNKPIEYQYTIEKIVDKETNNWNLKFKTINKMEPRLEILMKIVDLYRDGKTPSDVEQKRVFNEVYEGIQKQIIFDFQQYLFGNYTKKNEIINTLTEKYINPLNNPLDFDIIECLKELKYGRPKQVQDKLDKIINDFNKVELDGDLPKSGIGI